MLVVTMGIVTLWSILEVKRLFIPRLQQQLSIFYFKTEKNTINLYSVMESLIYNIYFIMELCTKKL